MVSQGPQHLLRVPTPTQRSLTFCEASPNGLKHWLDQLPRAKLGEVARLLYQGLMEINQLIQPNDMRLRLLELLRPEVYRTCTLLERHVLDQPIVLDERSRKVANLCQALQNHLAAGYKLVVTEELAASSRDRNTLLPLALQRALRSLQGPLIRAALLYTPASDHLWLELHQLFLLAQRLNLHTQRIRDDLVQRPDGQSPQEAYCAALLFGTARCNQIRQRQIIQLVEYLDRWASLVQLKPADQADVLFVVAPQIDAPARYRTLLKEANLKGLLGLSTHSLVGQISDYLALPPEERSRARLPAQPDISTDLLQHVRAAWGQESDRAFQRTSGQGRLEVCIGMSALHFHLSGRLPFAQTLNLPAPPAAKPDFAPAQKADVWSLAFDAEYNTSEPGDTLEEIRYETPGTVQSQEPELDKTYPLFSLPIVNHSPGGYCVSWPNEVPDQLQAGEVVGLRGTNEHSWGIAVIRWIRQVRGGGTQMGLELLAPTARPCGLQLLRKAEQNSQYLRGLLLPEIKAIDQAPTLIAPRLPFQEGSKVQINQNGMEQQGMLTHRQSATVSFSIFEYRLLESASPPPPKPGKEGAGSPSAHEDDFDSLWKSL
ncbi:hypothetical protein IQ22_03547 [Pseudomonas duriflava]|uniref:Molecular chaperone n=1 Tax=Pseudomonas duriflava TaxID=459528 RepID=A0A562Q6Q0_9PSED|nr:molecular chaperone [Pseudomonas duriflava]TWI52403.1 hypothetical protein IQ22_03547 [Pseudomonas duriflava]